MQCKHMSMYVLTYDICMYICMYVCMYVCNALKFNVSFMRTLRCIALCYKQLLSFPILNNRLAPFRVFELCMNSWS